MDPVDQDTVLFSSINNRQTKCTKRLLHACDTLLSLFVISPLVVAHWRGTWSYMDNNSKHFPPWNCFILGGVLHTTFALLREPLQAEFSLPSNGVKSKWKTLKRYFITKIYTYLFSIGCIMHWRGGWAVMQLYLGPDIWPAIAVSVICFIPLLIMKSTRNLVAPPVIIITDHKEYVFSFPTRFRIKGSREPGLYVLDCVFSVLVIGSLVVFVWRGLWVLLDLRLFPDDKALSAWGSLFIGYGVVGVTFSLQPVMRWTCERLEGFWRVAVADLFIFFSFVGTVNVWRGVWQLLDIYFLPDNKLLSDWITHGVSLLLLILLNCSNSVLVRGVYIDAEEPAGRCVVFPVYYIRLFFQKERSKKQKRLLESLEKGDHNNITVAFISKPLNNNKSLLAANQNHKIVRSMEELPLKLCPQLELEIDEKSRNISSDQHHITFCQNN